MSGALPSGSSERLGADTAPEAARPRTRSRRSHRHSLRRTFPWLSAVATALLAWASAQLLFALQEHERLTANLAQQNAAVRQALGVWADLDRLTTFAGHLGRLGDAEMGRRLADLRERTRQVLIEENVDRRP